VKIVEFVDAAGEDELVATDIIVDQRYQAILFKCMHVRDTRCKLVQNFQLVDHGQCIFSSLSGGFDQIVRVATIFTGLN
jgi:hypothetical protein